MYLYQNSLVALVADKGINNGTPFFHAAWIGAVAPQPGDVIAHIGAGTGYYSAILSMLVLEGGCVNAFEIEEQLAAAARHNLAPFDNVSVIAGDAVSLPLPPSDVIYVNAGVLAPPLQWLQALLSWGPNDFSLAAVGDSWVSALVTRSALGFKLLMPAWFIPCIRSVKKEQRVLRHLIPTRLGGLGRSD